MNQRELCHHRMGFASTRAGDDINNQFSLRVTCPNLLVALARALYTAAGQVLSTRKQAKPKCVPIAKETIEKQIVLPDVRSGGFQVSTKPFGYSGWCVEKHARLERHESLFSGIADHHFCAGVRQIRTRGGEQSDSNHHMIH